MVKKKSQMIIGSQMTILFSLIAGAFILIFFVTLSNSAKSNADMELDQKLLMDMKEMLKNSRGPINSFKPLNIPKEIEFKNSCEGFYLENLPKISNNYIFAPDSIKGRIIYSYSTQLLMPFYINDISLISSEKINNIFVEELGVSSTFISIFLDSPEEISFPGFNNNRVKTVDFSDIDKMKNLISKNDIETRFIYFGNDIAVISSIRTLVENLNPKRYTGNFYLINVNGNYDLNTVTSESKIRGTNQLDYYFYNKNTDLFISKGTSYSYGRTFLHAAINVDSDLNYDCQINLLQKDYERISKLYIGKTEAIMDNLNILETGGAIDWYRTINQSLNNLLVDFDGIVDVSKANSIKNSINLIETYQNLILSSSRSIPLIY